MITVAAPAKINLTLEVLGKRDDGYHEIRSVIQTLKFGDILHFSRSEETILASNMPGWSPEKSLISKALNLMKEATGYQDGVKIELEKNIPLSSGLGGDSSDAAAVLRGLNELWKTGLSKKQLLEIAPNLGSDVSFFIYGGTCLMEGRGEKVRPLPHVPHLWVILVMPSIPSVLNKTKNAYASLKPSHYTDGQITEKVIGELMGHHFCTSNVFNTFENVIFIPGNELSTYRSHILKVGAPNVHLAGSGPTLFTTLADKNQAEDLFKNLKNQGLQVYLTETG